MSDPRIDSNRATTLLRTADAHAGLLDPRGRTVWIQRPGVAGSHAAMLRGGSPDAGALEKDALVCFWFHPPGSAAPIHGHRFDADAAHLMVRLEPRWDPLAMALLAAEDQRRIDLNRRRHEQWARQVVRAYRDGGLRGELRIHLIGPRPADCVFELKAGA